MAKPTPSTTDGYPTETTEDQKETEEILLAHIPQGSTQPAPLQKNAHLQFLLKNLTQGFPARYISQDASQPWLMFWTLQGFSVMGVGIDPNTKQKAIDTIMAWQHPDGGFGGGPGQVPHLLPTYAAVCALAIVGRPGPGGGWDQIDRKKVYEFLMSVKEPDGSFLVSRNAEVDVRRVDRFPSPFHAADAFARGIYCLLVVAHLLDLVTPELVEGTPEFIASCQTYEGGFSSSSCPYFSPGSPPTLLASPRPALGEAHGGYTFCALACWVMLRPYLDLGLIPTPQTTPPSIDKRKLLRWLVQMQGSEIELGGFKGRTNKLVDGCYSWWVGGAFALLEALGGPQRHESDNSKTGSESQVDEAAWDDIDDSLLNRTALQEYILYAGQHPAGGLRDKPPKGADAYHTLYCLSGLSAAQHHVYPSEERRGEIANAWKSSESKIEPYHKTAFVESLSWIEEEGVSQYVGGSVNRVNATHPVFNLTSTHTEGIMAHFYGQTVPRRVLKKTSAQ